MKNNIYDQFQFEDKIKIIQTCKPKILKELRQTKKIKIIRAKTKNSIYDQF